MNELKPCPFCGYEHPKMTCKRSGNLRRDGDMYQIICGRCKARGPIFTAKYKFSGGRYYPVYIEGFENGKSDVEMKQAATDAWDRREDHDQT